MSNVNQKKAEKLIEKMDSVVSRTFKMYIKEDIEDISSEEFELMKDYIGVYEASIDFMLENAKMLDKIDEVLSHIDTTKNYVLSEVK